MTEPLFVVVSFSDVRKIIKYGGTHLLMSYWFLKGKTTKNTLEKIQQERIKHSILSSIFMLDSGAYSAWKNGFIIPLYEYIDFVKSYHHYFTHIVCLDVIDNPIYSEVNHLIMLEELKGYDLTIIPVFHSGESFSVLDYMIAKGYKYIGISPNNKWVEKEKRFWLHQVYSRYDFDSLGIKTHGFGYQSVNGLLQFPMTTADSVTWKVGEMFGRVIDPTGRELKYSMDSFGSPDHIDSIPGGDTQFIKDLCDDLGFSPEEMKTNYHLRDKFNVAATVNLLKREKKNVSIVVDLLSDVDSSFGYCDDFSEEKVLKLYGEAKALGRKYTGSSEIEVKYVKLKKESFNDYEQVQLF